VREIAEERFREDLYYRVNVVNLHLPPLRERAEDIPLLATLFIEKFATRFGLQVRRLTPEALDLLRRYPFPGNVRELENLMEGAVALTNGEAIESATLPETLRRTTASSPMTATAGAAKSTRSPPVQRIVPEESVQPVASMMSESEQMAVSMIPEEGVDLEKVLADTERQLIHEALKRSGGNKTKAAEILGLSFRSFRYRLSKLKEN
ncbi:MAG: sigma-54-dependent Fis family transcriptional regulator, partial [Magnetococcales bacterium]|nr:sigma-54-dependent Fis family transcriptional regulator [Magnetococcales bacterium]